MMGVTLAADVSMAQAGVSLSPSLIRWRQVQGYPGVLPDVLACPAEPS